MAIKDKMVGVHLEEPVFELLGQVAREDAVSNSSYLRGLLLNDLRRRDRLPSDVLLLLAGGSIEPAVELWLKAARAK